MKRSLFGVAIACLVVTGSLLLAQTPRPILPPGIRPGVGLHNSSQTHPAERLSRNDRVTLLASVDQKELGKVSGLTCAPPITIAGPFAASSDAAYASLEATLQEMDDRVEVAYSLGLSLTNLKKPISAQGTLSVKPGTDYRVVEAGGAKFTLSVAPEPEESA